MFENEIKFSKSKYTDYLYSSNQIMFYRMSIIVGLCFILMILLAIFGFGVKFESKMMLPVVFGLIVAGVGIFSALKRRKHESIITRELNK
ncbi:MAG: hypothetical protein A2X82_07910 [Geobacteraceae bacterium GWC2_55_20]|nr:MAG: hypothetical protein A2X82_07910 [Geobacteraceae bacterium GWC2_55_20]OGU23441.1 MAG: hypothetical protein A2X85_06530 [Geobacteraceae bacterium GWF2_54_21]HBA72975.1 hypothetical protein [Geobacter sp.]HCE68787.1 hypothetical protein [Geobacter sp.]